MIDLNFINETDHETQPFEPLIEAIMKEITIMENLTAYYEVSVVFMTPEKIQAMNNEWRGMDSITDVISFALQDEPDFVLAEEAIPLGDIFICFDRAVQQANAYGHSLAREIGFLACHGFLHLLGYDHDNEEDEKDMFEKQQIILERVSLRRE